MKRSKSSASCISSALSGISTWTGGVVVSAKMVVVGAVGTAVLVSEVVGALVSGTDRETGRWVPAMLKATLVGSFLGAG